MILDEGKAIVLPDEKKLIDMWIDKQGRLRGVVQVDNIKSVTLK